MRAITYSRYGPPEVLGIEDVEAPTPKDDEVLVRVRAVEATKADCELRSFRFSVKWFWLPLRVAVGVTRPRERILGSYFAGVVERTGSQVTRLKEGDEVFGSLGFGRGCYAEYVTLAEHLGEAARAPFAGENLVAHRAGAGRARRVARAA